MTSRDVTDGKAAGAGDSPRTWQPLLDGELADRAHQTIADIANLLREPDPAWYTGDQADEAAGGNCIPFGGGYPGLAVLFAYLAQAWSRDEYWDDASRFIEQTIDLMVKTTIPPGLYGGFTGVAWAVAHLGGDEADDEADNETDVEDPNHPIDEALRSYLERSPWTGDYDLISGLVGFGIYSLERLPTPSARICLQQIITHLDELAQQVPPGLTWHTPPELLPAHQRELHPAGHYNLGVAHGVPGVIGLLGEAYAAGVSADRCHALLAGAVPWLLAQELPADAATRFPYSVATDNTPVASRMAWCYGDPGVATVLLAAARFAREADWETEALRIAAAAAACPADADGIVDAGLCHGAVGLAHMYNRMYQATGADFLADAARHWYERTLDMRQEDRGIAGYEALLPAPDNQVQWGNDPGFLTGVAGIALALLAATSSIEPAWDRVLLTSIPLSARTT